jgi:hypothetical protein
MQGWHTTFLGMRGLPRDISDFEMKAFFTFDGAERDAINARRGDSHKLGLALHIGFLRMSGRLLGAFRVIPVALWRHLGNELGIAAPEVASLRAMYERGRTLFDHQQVACTVLGFQWMSEHQRRSLVRELRDEVARCADRDQLLVRARQWLYKNKLVIVHERAIRTLIAAALAQLEVETGTAIAASVDPATLDRWRASVSELRPDGQTQQSWLWAAPAKHSTRQISEVLERIDLLYTLDVHKHLADIPDLILRRYARRLVSRPPSAGAKIKEPARTVEVACFLRYCLFTTTDQLILMVQRRIADLWRQAAADVPATVNWAAMYKTLLGELVALSAQGAVPDAELRARLEALITETQKRKPPSRASLVREGLIDGIRPVRSLLVAIAKLPWQATGEHPAIEYLAKLQALYLKGSRKLPVEVVAPSLGMIWQVSISSPDRERAFQALEVATLFALRRAVRNGSVWIEHSLSFRGRARLFFTDERWQAESKKHYARLSLPSKAATFLKPLLARVTAGVDAVAAAARSGVLRVDDELHLSPLPAEDEDPEVTKLRAALDHRIGEVQLPEVILAVDAQVRFSWIMLGREPRSTDELLMVYAGIMAHGTSLTAVECARMIPQLSATSIRQAMRWARDERRLSQACQAVLEFMQRHPIAATWGRSDLASSDMMSMETTKRVWQARLDPRRNTPSIGIYSHVKDRWGIFHAQPFVLNERQAGVAIEGVIRQEKLETSQLAVDTHGYTDFAMSHARLLGFDLCPRLKELKQRHLFVPRGTKVPAEIAAVCEANVDVAQRGHPDAHQRAAHLRHRRHRGPAHAGAQGGARGACGGRSDRRRTAGQQGTGQRRLQRPRDPQRGLHRPRSGLGGPDRRPGQGARHQGQEGPVPLGGLGPRHCQRPRRRRHQAAVRRQPRSRIRRHGHGKILGGGMVGTHAGDMIGEIALAIEMGADAVDIGKTIHPHPTLGESIGMAAEVAHGSCTDVPPARK